EASRTPPAARVGPRSLPAQPVLGRAPDGISDPARQGRGDSDHAKARAKILIVGARASRRITAKKVSYGVWIRGMTSIFTVFGVNRAPPEIGRASCRERVWICGVVE